MLKNHFKLAWRNLLKDRQFSFLNLIGLSSGLACVLLVYLWVTDELHVDKFFANDNRLYQVMKTAPNADGTIATHEHTPGILREKMANELSEVQYSASVRREDVSIISSGDKEIKAIFYPTNSVCYYRMNSLLNYLVSPTTLLGKQLIGITEVSLMACIKLPVFLQRPLLMLKIRLTFYFPSTCYCQKKRQIWLFGAATANTLIYF